MKTVGMVLCAASITIASAGVFAQTQTGRTNGGVSEEIEGTLEVFQEDSRGGPRLRYFLLSGAAHFELEFGANQPRLLTGARVRARGVRVGPATLALESGTTSVTTVTAAALPNTIGEQRVVVLLVNFQNDPVEPHTLAYAHDVVFNTSNNHTREDSYQRSWLAGDTFGWFTIAMNNNVCDPTRLATLAQQAATDAGVDLSRYSRYVYVFPEVPCSWWGRGSIGGNPSHVWVNGDLDYRVVSHELGHNLGLYHAHSLDCGSSPIVAPCTSSDYGDVLDMMGAAQGHFSIFAKERLGWMGSGGSPAIVVANDDGNFWLEPVETLSSGGAKGLKIPKSVDPVTGVRTWYYVELRQAIGFDNFLSTNTNVLNGVVIRTGSDSGGNTSYLLDMTPETASWNDPALSAGKSFTDPDARITITTLSADVSGAFVAVSVAEAPPPPPTPLPSPIPTVQVSTSKSSYSRGVSVPITANVTVQSTAASGASVSFKVTRPDGSVGGGTTTTSSTGVTTYTFQSRKRDPIGVYMVTATTSLSGVSAGASTSFTVVK